MFNRIGRPRNALVLFPVDYFFNAKPDISSSDIFNNLAKSVLGAQRLKIPLDSKVLVHCKIATKEIP